MPTLHALPAHTLMESNSSLNPLALEKEKETMNDVNVIETSIRRSGKAQFKRRAILMSNLIVFKLNCRTTVDSNVEFNLVMPDSSD